MSRWWYAANLIGLAGAVLEFTDVALGYSMPRWSQLLWIGFVAWWIVMHAWVRHMYEQEKEISDKWEENSDAWRGLYERASSELRQKRRSMWS